MLPRFFPLQLVMENNWKILDSFCQEAQKYSKVESQSHGNSIATNPAVAYRPREDKSAVSLGLITKNKFAIKGKGNVIKIN